MRTIIAGSRNCPHYHLICQAVEEAGWEITTVISGCARGADRLVRARNRKLEIVEQFGGADLLPLGETEQFDRVVHGGSPFPIVKFRLYYSIEAAFLQAAERIKKD